MSKVQLNYDRDVVLGVLRDLEQIVVSLDRIGSEASRQDGAKADATLAGFVREWNVFGKLARARSILSEPFGDELEFEVSDVSVWGHPGSRPQRNV